MSSEHALRVMIVEDAAVISRYLLALVENVPGVALAAVTDSVSGALALLGQAEPDIIILDIHLPDGNGLTVLEAAKQRPHPPWVIVFTGSADYQYKRQALLAGAEYFIDKNKNFLQVEKALLEIIYQAEARQQNRDPA
ncbi:MAG: response regulator [Anaerolineae bacterium]|nr:MAG: response regulator [Anaerolineae bacterium]